MKRLLAALWRAISSRALLPLVLGFFLLAYIVIAFFTDEALITLIALTGKNFLLAGVLALIPLNCLCRIVLEARRGLARRRALKNAQPLPDPALYDESVELSSAAPAGDLEQRLTDAGYRTWKNGELLSAWRGVSLWPVRLLFLAGLLCLFGGILISVTSRQVSRQPMIEGVPFQAPSGQGGFIQRIVLRNADGPILLKELLMEVSGSEQGGSFRTFGVYPPALFGGAFVYPRYLGIALTYRFTAPDLPAGFQDNGVFPIYPPGREAQLPLGGAPYKVHLTLAKSQDGSDPYMTGSMEFVAKVVKGNDQLFTGTVKGGGELVRDGIKLAIIDARRMVVTDFVVDYGVLSIWLAGFLFTLGACLWLPVRLFLPRREMVFSWEGGGVLARSRAEGSARRHTGVFHEVLDVIAAEHA
ncbi:MAG TPA: hypothetical protein VJ550_11540 [Geomonas sp.]|nr:hypothetical protein [Geomonas sp.]